MLFRSRRSGKLPVVSELPLRGHLRNGGAIRRSEVVNRCSVSFSTFRSALPVVIVVQLRGHRDTGGATNRSKELTVVPKELLDVI